MTLAESCLLIADCPHTTARDEGVGYPLVRTPNVGFGRLVYAGMHRVSEKVYNCRNKRAVPSPGDLIYAREAPAGNVAVIEPGEKVCLGQRTVLLRPNPRVVDSHYLAYYLLSPEHRNELVGQASGATVLHVNLSDIRSLKVSFPKIDVQRRIVAVVNDYYSAIDNARRQIALLEEAAMRLYREWFGDGRQEKVLLVDVASVTYGFPFVGKLFNDKGLGLPIIRIRNVPEGLSKDFTTEKAPDRYIVKDGDILIGMDGEFYVNFWSGGDAYLVQRTCRLRPNDAHMFGFVLEAIKGPIRAFQSAIVGSTVGHLGKKDIDTISIPIPKDKKIVDLLQDGFEQRLTLMKQICSLTEARDRLLPKLMSGEIEV